MKCTNLIHLGLFAVLLISCQERKRNNVKADVAYVNGKIYTVNEKEPWAEAVAIKDGKFIKVGSNNDIQKVYDTSTKIIDLKGQFVMPGITDMHAHPFSGVDLGTGSINLENPGDKDAIIADVKKYVQEHPDKQVYLGGNWNVGGLFDNDSPDKKLLDEIIPDKPQKHCNWRE
jgi:predicted amidohydrolase YtcJ